MANSDTPTQAAPQCYKDAGDWPTKRDVKTLLDDLEKHIMFNEKFRTPRRHAYKVVENWTKGRIR